MQTTILGSASRFPLSTANRPSPLFVTHQPPDAASSFKIENGRLPLSTQTLSRPRALSIFTMPPRPSSRGAKLKTRARKAVCRCVSHGCSKYTFITVDGKRERGVELAIDTQKRHAVSDLLIRQPQTTDTRKPREPSQYCRSMFLTSPFFR